MCTSPLNEWDDPKVTAYRVIDDMNTLTSAPWGADAAISTDVAVTVGTLAYPLFKKVYVADDTSLNTSFATSIFAGTLELYDHLGVRLINGYTFTYLDRSFFLNVVDPMMLSSKL